MEFNEKIKETLRFHYNGQRADIADRFDSDCAYLERAFNEINTIWLENLEKITTVNFIMLAEAPLWSKSRSYIYNPDTRHSQFFFHNDLNLALGLEEVKKSDKSAFIDLMNETGLVVLDISPFAFNKKDTVLNYGEMNIEDYEYIIEKTLPSYFEEKLKLISRKKSDDCKVFFRYKRVKYSFEDLLEKPLIRHNFIKDKSEIGEISKQGGGIDREKLKAILN